MNSSNLGGPQQGSEMADAVPPLCPRHQSRGGFQILLPVPNGLPGNSLRLRRCLLVRGDAGLGLCANHALLLSGGGTRNKQGNYCGKDQKAILPALNVAQASADRSYRPGEAVKVNIAA